MPQGKFHPYENDVRVPFMIRGPGIFSESSVRDDIVATHVDVMPTLLGLIDGGVHDSVSIPSTMDGRNLAKDLLNAGRRGHDGVANIESSSVSPPSIVTGSDAIESEASFLPSDPSFDELSANRLSLAPVRQRHASGGPGNFVGEFHDAATKMPA